MTPTLSLSLLNKQHKTESEYSVFLNMDDSETNKNNNNANTSNNVGVGIGGILETKQADNPVWLMKCPSLVSRSLQTPQSSLGGPTRPVAKVVLSIDPLKSNDDDSSRQFTMELSGTESGNVPKSYSLDISKDFIPMSVFSESSKGKVAVEGKIIDKFDMRPHPENLESYGKLCRERTSKYMTRTRQIQVIGNDNGTHMRPLPVMFASSAAEKKKPLTKASDTKRTRRDRGEMEEIMFKLFERQSNWTLRQLILETNQPEQFLKDMLKELCVYNNKGTNQGSYELKPEYKKSNEDEAP